MSFVYKINNKWVHFHCFYSRKFLISLESSNFTYLKMELLFKIRLGAVLIQRKDKFILHSSASEWAIYSRWVPNSRIDLVFRRKILNSKKCDSLHQYILKLNIESWNGFETCDILWNHLNERYLPCLDKNSEAFQVNWLTAITSELYSKVAESKHNVVGRY